MLIERTAFYCAAPILRLDAQLRIADYNLALEALFADRLNGWHLRSAANWLASLQSSISGDLLPAAILDPALQTGIMARHGSGQVLAKSNTSLTSELFGHVRLQASGICLLDQDSGDFEGIVISWRIDHIDRADFYEDRLRQLWTRQLVWEMYAVSYDVILPRLEFYTAACARHIAAMSMPEIARAADLGAGTGSVALPLVQSGREVWAVELSHAMLDKLQKKSSSAKGLHLIQANAEQCSGIADAAVDGVTILLALYDMDRPRDALAEALRILRPGGRIVLTEPRRGIDLGFLLKLAEDLLAKQGLLDSNREHFQRVFLANHERDPTRRADRLYAEEIFDLLEAARFEDLSLVDSHSGQCATIVGTKRA